MDVLGIRDHLIEGYRSLIKGYVDITNEGICSEAEKHGDQGHQRPEPWLPLSHSFNSWGSVDELVSGKILHSQSSEFVRSKKCLADRGASQITLYKNQAKVLEIAAKRQSYVLPTGTGANRLILEIFDEMKTSHRWTRIQSDLLKRCPLE